MKSKNSYDIMPIFEEIYKFFTTESAISDRIIQYKNNEYDYFKIPTKLSHLKNLSHDELILYILDRYDVTKTLSPEKIQKGTCNNRCTTHKQLENKIFVNGKLPEDILEYYHAKKLGIEDSDISKFDLNLAFKSELVGFTSTLREIQKRLNSLTLSDVNEENLYDYLDIKLKFKENNRWLKAVIELMGTNKGVVSALRENIKDIEEINKQFVINDDRIKSIFRNDATYIPMKLYKIKDAILAI